MLLNKFTYKGSYLIIPNDLTIGELTDYLVKPIGKYKVYYSEEVYMKEISHNNTKLMLIGYCFDIRDFKLSEDEILKNIILAEDTAEELDYINGRYNILIQKEDTVELYSDASQLQPLVYHHESKALASHDLLLYNILKINEVQNIDKISDRQSELDFTRFENIYKFNPSLKLTLNTFNFERIYPREELVKRSVEEVADEIKPYLDHSISWLKNQPNEKFLTITGGIDSRLSAALTNSFSDQVEYLTYYSPAKKLASQMARLIHLTDRKIAEQFKNNLKWNHSIINIFDYQPNSQEYNYYNELFNSRHAFGLINYYRNEKKYNHAIHVKSTVYGLGKADFDNDLDEKEDTYSFYHRCIHGIGKEFTKNYDLKSEVNGYFKRNLINEGVTKNRHYFDLFHLESRMGNWHSVITLETDPEVDEFIFVNARKLIDLIQQPPVEDRRKFNLYKTLINRYWPVLLHFGINKQKNMFETSRTSSEFLSSTIVESLNKITLAKEEDKIIAVPEKGKVRVEDIFSFNIRTKYKNIRLSSLYNNPKGKGKLKVIIRNEGYYEFFDIVHLNKGVILEAKETPYSVMILYNNTFKRETWSQAGKIIIEEL